MATIKSARTNDQLRSVAAAWSDGATTFYPFLWLRDNCQCKTCFHPPSTGRRFLMKNLKPDVQPSDVNVTSSSFTVTWSDEHVSEFEAAWLQERDFTEEKKFRDQWEPRKPKLWGSELQNNIPRLEFDKVLTDDRTLFDWILHLEVTGLVILTGAPLVTDQLQRLGKRVSFLRNHNFGVPFTVKSELKPNNLAYTNATLGMHTDLSYYDHTPGMQMLHCIKQVKTEGGENEFADSFSVAEQMRQEKPDHFKLLSTLPVDFHDIRLDNHFIRRTPIFRLGEDGQLVQTTFNNQMRDSILNVNLKEVDSLYKAFLTFSEMLNGDKNIIRLKLSDGDIACFDNRRVMHGRSGFEVIEAGERHLEGGYIDWDELYSRRRVLQKALNIQL